MWVVKLGGSLGRDPLLPQWLALLARQRGPVVVVPGGGTFADAARAAQAHWQLDDLAGHNMAVLGMAQTGVALTALCPALQPAHDEAALRAGCRAGRPMLWWPLDLLRHAPDELTHWGVTSDSLALWLARRLDADGLMLVKSCAIAPQAALADLVQAGVLDREFAALAAGFERPIVLLHKHELARADALLAAGPVSGG